MAEAPPIPTAPAHPLRRLMRRLPALRRALAAALPYLQPLLRWLEAPRYDRWFARWQASGAADDAAIAALVGAAAPIRVILPPGASAARASLAAQIAVPWTEAPLAQGLVLRLAPGDRLVRHALAELALAARASPRPLVIYADEDSPDHGHWIKPAFDPDLLRQQPAFGRAVAYDAGLLLRHGLATLEGHALMCAAAGAAVGEAGVAAIHHIPAILLHRAAAAHPPWREAGGAPPSRLPMPLPPALPPVTIIVPTRNATALVEACIEGLLNRTDYAPLEVLICDNDSTEAGLLRRFADWARDPRIRILPCPGPFNFAAINNRAAQEALGEILVFLNNDTEIRHADWLREMVGHAMRPEIGAVGAKLLFPNGRVQHAGIVLGLGGVAGYDMVQARGDDPGPQDVLCVTRSVSAVTAACMAVRRAAFLDVGGFDEQALRVAYNDVDLCLKLRGRGLRNLITPHAVLLHKESATRGDDRSPEHAARFAQEQATMRARWGDALLDDPCYSPLYALGALPRVLAEPPRRLAPWRRLSRLSA